MSIWPGSISLRSLRADFLLYRVPNTTIVLPGKVGFSLRSGIKAVSYPDRLGWGMHSPGS
jgi:hypothetical protein